MQRPAFKSVATLQPLVELDPSQLTQVAGGEGGGPHGGWTAPSSPAAGNPPTAGTFDETWGPHGGWKTDGPHGGW